MIVVLADDLAGAAEMGGMAWRHGLSAEVRTGADLQRRFEGLTGAGVDVLVLDTDTRSCAPDEAARRVRAIAAPWRNRGVRAVYKKVDSVLRGPVAAELGALLEVLGYGQCLLVPANPGLGRVISAGQYLVDGVPLHKTDFRHDPEYPATTADVLERVAATARDDLWPTSYCPLGDLLAERGITIGEAGSAADLAIWAAQGVCLGVLFAGASEFFGAFLHALGYPPVARSPMVGSGNETRELYVCGSTSAGSRAFCRQSEMRGVPVLRLPDGLLQPPGALSSVDALIGHWADEVVCALADSPRAIVAIDRPLCPEPGMPQVLGQYLSAAVEQVLGLVEVDRLYAEGGATAVALVQRMGWTCMRVQCEWATGVVTLQVAGQDTPLVSMKPGSYAWPKAILG